jgi:hypothetical protein
VTWGRRRPHWTTVAVGLLAAAAAGASLLVQLHWFPHLSKDNDEPVYLFQAELYRHGLATLSAAAMGRSFRPWMSGPVGDRLIMVFPPGWPVVLAVVRTVTGTWRVVPAFSAAAVVVSAYAFARELLGERVPALVTAALVASCPMLVVLTGTVLTYPAALAVDAAIGTAALRAVRTGRPRTLAVVGLAVAALFSMRPVDAGILTVVFGSYVLGSWRRQPSYLGRGLAWAAAGAAPIIAAVLAYNTKVTGAPLRFPLQAQGGDNRFGFGTRWITVDAPRFDVTPSMMWKVTTTLLGELPRWLTGGMALLPLAAIGIVLVTRRTGTAKAAALVGLLVAYPAAHFFYWGTYFVTVGRREYGPFYYLPMVLPLCLAAAVAIHAVGRRLRPVGLAAVAVLVAVALAGILPPKLAYARRHTTAVGREIRLVDRLPRPAVVILPATIDGPWILHVRGYFANRVRLGGDRIYAADDGASNVALFDRFGRLPIYQLYGIAPDGHPERPPLPHAARLRRIAAPELSVTATFTNPTINPTVVSYVATPQGLDRCVADEESQQGRRYTVHWTVTDAGAVPDPGCAPLPRLGVFDTLNGYLLAGFTAAGNTDFDGVNRWEDFYSLRSRPAHLEILTPGLPRRTSAGDLGDPQPLFLGRVEGTLHVDVKPGVPGPADSGL